MPETNISETRTPEIYNYHAHVYFGAETLNTATKLVNDAGNEFELIVGRIHQKPVGPHPCWSCQLAFRPELFGEVVPWLALNRNGLTVFIHPETGNDYRDHSEYAIWLGEIKPVKLSMFKK